MTFKTNSAVPYYSSDFIHTKSLVTRQSSAIGSNRTYLTGFIFCFLILMKLNIKIPTKPTTMAAKIDRHKT